MPHKFDRNIPSPLPVHRMLERPRLVGMPTVVDMRPACGPVKDQGNEGACTAHAGTSDKEWIDRRYLKAAGIYSPQYTYEKELLMQGSFPNDVGSDGTTLCRVLIANGCCELALDPYVPGKIVQPTLEQDANAAKHTLGAYHGLQGSETALSVICDPVPWPVLVGFTVRASFESSDVAETGIYNPQPDEQVVGGHEVLLIGCDIGTVPSLRPLRCPPAVLIQNSWGTDWGWQGGFFWMPLSVLDDVETDMKIAHSGHPWK